MKRHMACNTLGMHRRAAQLALGAALTCAEYAHAQDNPAEALEFPTVEVIGSTLLPGLATPIQLVPANAQIITSKNLDRQRQNNITDYLEQNPTSITVNAAQGNPYQPDI